MSADSGITVFCICVPLLVLPRVFVIPFFFRAASPWDSSIKLLLLLYSFLTFHDLRKPSSRLGSGSSLPRFSHARSLLHLSTLAQPLQEVWKHSSILLCSSLVLSFSSSVLCSWNPFLHVFPIRLVFDGNFSV